MAKARSTLLRVKSTWSVAAWNSGSEAKGTRSCRIAYLADGYSRSNLIDVHIVIVHDEVCATAQARWRPYLWEPRACKKPPGRFGDAIAVQRQVCVVVSKDRGVPS